MTQANSYRANSDDTTFERLDGETIIINLTTGHYYSLSGPAADVFYLCCSGASADRWWEILENSYSSPPLGREVNEFVQALLEAGLIVHADEIQSGITLALPSDFTRGAWTTPRLEEFEDLQDLILVDPIHDTTNLGWPHVEENHD